MTFEVPERLRYDSCPSNIAPDAAFAMAHPPEEEFVDPTDWETEFFSELEPEKIFSSPGTLQSLYCRETKTPFSTLVKDFVSLTLIEKMVPLKVCLSSQDSSSQQQHERQDCCCE